MTRIGPQVGEQFRRRTGALAVLGAVYLPVAVRRRARPGRRSAQRVAAVAAAGPLLLIGSRLARSGMRRPPALSALGRLVLGGYVASGALVEELMWRAPLTLPRTARGRVCAAGLSGSGFLLLHLRRDGAASAPAHLITTASWTTAAVLARRLRWVVLSHALYNYLVISLGPIDPGTAQQLVRQPAQ
jgi:hypothetical protein